MCWRWFVFGRLLPDTAVAKAQPVPTAEDIGKAGELIQYAGLPAVLLAVGCVAAVLAGSPGGRSARQRARWGAVQQGTAALLVPLALAIAAAPRRAASAARCSNAVRCNGS